MPEAAVNKNADPLLWKREVRATGQRKMSPPSSDTRGSEHVRNLKLG